MQPSAKAPPLGAPSSQNTHTEKIVVSNDQSSEMVYGL